ncbi:MAG: enolase C-terminal domain-like protein [Burkholderiales bacterium]
MGSAPTLTVHAIEARVRPVHLRLPFRFGAATLTACPQLFVRVEAEVAGLGRAEGFAAELMVPKWFDKRAEFSPQGNVAHLALAVTNAAAAYANDAPATSFGLFARHREALGKAGAVAGLTELSSTFGAAVIDRAVIDALCRAMRLSFFEAARRNLFGVDRIDDLRGWDWPNWFASLQPLRRIEARHTVGLLDELDSLRVGVDGLPISLRAVIRRYRHRAFKIKLGGDPAADLTRLRAVLAVLDAEVGEFRYTLDGNEQYASMDTLAELLLGLKRLPAPLYIEQPVPRELSLATRLPKSAGVPFLMDEADGTLDAFPRGRAMGWTGVSSKACKGVYKALINRARCDHWNAESGAPRHFMSAEDLTCQAGLAVQQDLALVALLGITHSERNGHHYGHGFGDDAPAAEQAAFRRAHAGLYDDDACLRIAHGEINIDSLFAPGYARTASPDWQATRPLADATELL